MSIQPVNNAGANAYSNLAINRSSGTSAAKTESTSSANNADTVAAVAAKVADNNRQNAAADKQSVKEAAQRANQTVVGLRSDLKFSVDDDTGSNVVKLVDVKTKEVIRQIPAQEMLVIAKRLDELQGLLIKEQA